MRNYALNCTSAASAERVISLVADGTDLRTRFGYEWTPEEAPRAPRLCLALDRMCRSLGYRDFMHFVRARPVR